MNTKLNFLLILALPLYFIIGCSESNCELNPGILYTDEDCTEQCNSQFVIDEDFTLQNPPYWFDGSNSFPIKAQSIDQSNNLSLEIDLSELFYDPSVYTVQIVTSCSLNSCNEFSCESVQHIDYSYTNISGFISDGAITVNLRLEDLYGYSETGTLQFQN